ncbi:MAG: aminotransferase class V-fold PLP-dependent enzyme [Deltaproteobacteria bacterium]|nr:aminotransferase class V-fold PLP-dependent enzyme [Deltaproteobacteria bacterium]
MARQIPLFKVFLPPEDALIPRLRDVLYSGQVSEGQPVYDFEKRFSNFVGLPNVLSFYSGTAALHTALLLAGVTPGDDVLSTAMTAEPTNMAIRHAGANVVWADVDPRNGNLTATSISEHMTPRVRAIMVVHYGGIPAPMADIQSIAEAWGVPVIEDAAHALGARYGNAPIGSNSDYTIFSLQAIKHMTTIDGGMLACKNPEHLFVGRKLRWFGIDRAAPRTEVDVDVVGYKYHMNNVNATIGLVQLDFIGPVVQRHIENGKFFDVALQSIPGIELCQWDPKAEPSYWFYTVLADDRDGLSRRLTEFGVANSTAHKRNDTHSVFAGSRRELPGLDRFYSRMLHIPCGWWVGDIDREQIANVIRHGW